MSEIWVDEVGLDGLSAGVADAGAALDAGCTTFGSSATGRDLGLATARHDAAVDRWQGGLATAVDALAEISASIAACAVAYRAGDDDQAVVFTGITS